MRRPTQLPTQGQWWSKRSTQLSQMEQCVARGGRYRLHVSQNFTRCFTPFTDTFCVDGGFFLLSGFPCDGSGRRGRMPGSMNAVMNRFTSAKRIA